MFLKSIQQREKIAHFSWFILFLFIGIYACSLTLYYAEGDDAATAFYHVTGRDSLIQKTYEPYHSGYDYLLSFLPSKEGVIRYAMILSTAIAQPIMVIVLLLLAFQWLNLPSRSIKACIVSLLLLLSIPELFFMGLYYNPTIVAMALLITSHLLLRNYFVNYQNKWSLLFISLFLFSFGSTLRWNTTAYGLVIVLDILINVHLNRKQVLLVLSWGFFALTLFLGFLWVEGIGMKEIHYALGFEDEINQKIIRSLGERIRINSPFFTPGLVLLMLIGLYDVLTDWKKEIRFILFSLICFIANYIIVSSLFFKVLAPIYVLIFYFTAKGVLWLYNKKGLFAKLSWLFVLIIILAPWFVGICMQNTRIWGPGYHLKEEYFSLSKFTQQQDKKKDYQWSFAFGSGIGFAHPEGPRPLWGYGYVLIGGEWRNKITRDRIEYEKMFQLAAINHYPLVKIGSNYNLENILYANGYKTKQSYKNELHPHVFIRSFVNERDTINIYRIEKESINTEKEMVRIIYKEFQRKEVILYSQYYGKPKLIDSCEVSNNSFYH